jgi:hypothetical protein
MFLQYLLFLFFTLQVSATYRQFRKSLGEVTTIISYDDTLNSNDHKFAVTYYNTTSIYLLQVSKFVLINRPICKNTITVSIPIRSRGCDVTQTYAVESCADGEPSSIENRLKLLSSMWYRYGSNQCIALNGDKYSCLGPVLAVMNHLPYVEVGPHIPMDYDVMVNTQGLMIRSTAGPMGNIYVTTWIDYYLPELYVVANENCLDQYNVSFNGTYEPYYKDNTDSKLINETRIYRRKNQAFYQRLLLRRNWPTSVYVYFELAEITSISGNFYSTKYTSTESVTEHWAKSLPLTINMTNGCNITITNQSTYEIELKEPDTLTDLDFYKNKYPPRYFFDQMCNYHVGRLDSNLDLVYPATREGVTGGGRVKFTTNGLLSLPIRVEKVFGMDDYSLDCKRFWPKQNSFSAYGTGPNDDGITNGNAVPPILKESDLCFFPFLNVLGLRDEESLDDSKSLNCFRQGGFVFGETLQFCAAPIQYEKCKKGWYYYDQYCYYKFNPELESKFRVQALNAQKACESLEQNSDALTNVLINVKAYIQERFIFIDRKGPGNPYFVNIRGRRCLSFDYLEATNSADDDVVVVEEISCNTPAFPICRYLHTLHQLPFQEYNMDANAIRVFQQSQDGLPHQGRNFPCECYNGWCSAECNIQCCPTQSTSFNDSLSLWYQKCISNGRGWCENGNPRSCKCSIGFGPPATWTESETYHEFPCQFPATPLYEPYKTTNKFSIGIFDYDQPEGEENYVCGSTDLGRGISVDGINYGRCDCKKRTSLIPSRWGTEEVGMGCASCSAPTSIVPPRGYQINGDIQAFTCNGIGYCCPSGESKFEQFLNEEYLNMYGREQCLDPITKNLVGGCVCPSGWSGLSCTCPVPKNILNPSLYRSQGLDKEVYGILIKRSKVNRVIIIGGCPVLPNVVSLRDGNEANLLYSCSAITNDNREWYCGDNIGNLVILSGVFDPISCRVEAYAEWFPPCGNYTNPYAGAFFANEFNRDAEFNFDPQPADLSVFGCTITECMCDPNHTGPKCKIGVSAYRYDYDFMALHKESIGLDYLPKRGIVLEDGEYQCQLRIGAFPPSRFVGDACEGEEVYDKKTGHWLMCNDRGTFIPANFPYGYCEYDLLDYEADPLSKPNIGNNPILTIENLDIFTVVTESIIRLADDRYWKFPKDTRLYVQGLRYFYEDNDTEVTLCSRLPLSLNISYVCEGLKTYPIRVYPLYQYWDIEFTGGDDQIGNVSFYSTTAVNCTTQDLDVIWCDSTWLTEINYSELDYIQDYRCLSAIYYLDDGDYAEEALPSGRYNDVQFLCNSVLRGEGIFDRELAFGLFDISNALDRLLADLAVEKKLVENHQIPIELRPYVPYSHIRGEAYGLFWDAIPSLKFNIEPWTEDHYRMIGSILNNKKCIQILSGKYDRRAYDSSLFMKNARQELYSGVAIENETAVAIEDDDYIQQEELDTFALSPTLATKKGYTFTLPTGTLVVRKVFVTIPIDGQIQGIQLFGPNGMICSTYYPRGNDTSFPVNTTIIFGNDCSSLITVEPLWQTFINIRGNSTNETEVEYNIQQFLSKTPRYTYTLIFVTKDPISTPIFKKSNFKFIGREETYNGLFLNIKKQIYEEHRFPLTSLFEQQCLEREVGREIQDINYTNPDDLLYIKDYWYAHLAPRRCADTIFCEIQARKPTNYECIRDDSDFTLAWRGGSNDFALLGDEGGCECFGMSKQPCIYCDKGYGPETIEELWAFYKFFDTTLENPPENEQYCSLPWDNQYTRVGVCGGRGTIMIDEYNRTIDEIHLFDGTKVRRCEALWYQEDILFLVEPDIEININIFTYVGQNSTLDIINGRIFLNDGDRELLVMRELDKDTLMLNDGNELFCQEWMYSKTHRVTGKKFVASNQDFWIAKLFGTIT